MRQKALDIGGRIFALFLSSSLAIVTGAAIFAPELELWKTAALAGFAAVANVVEKLARAGVDGSLTRNEISKAFGGKDLDQ